MAFEVASCHRECGGSSVSSASRITVGIVGAGQFSKHFGELFLAHPLVSRIGVADLVIARAREFSEHVPCEAGVFDSLESMLASEIDAVALFTPRNTHAALTEKALASGKHVYCAVPASFTVAGIETIVRLVEDTGLNYMSGETSYYYPSTLFCRDRFYAGEFGEFVYGEAQYVHDMSTWGPHFELSYGDEWKREAGMPPMYYPTHSVSMILSCTGSEATHVSAFGYRDTADDGVYGAGKNNYDNPFSNEFALMKTSDGGTVRVTEARRLGLFNGGKEVCLNMFYGTDACFEDHLTGSALAKRENHEVRDVSSVLACDYFPRRDSAYDPDAKTHGGGEHDGYLGVSGIHPVERLPYAFCGMMTGHNGSHQFLVDDFVKSTAARMVPPNNIWDAARYCVPGIIAHESALKEGARLTVPRFGGPPAGSRMLVDHYEEFSRE